MAGHTAYWTLHAPFVRQLIVGTFFWCLNLLKESDYDGMELYVECGQLRTCAHIKWVYARQEQFCVSQAVWCSSENYFQIFTRHVPLTQITKCIHFQLQIKIRKQCKFTLNYKCALYSLFAIMWQIFGIEHNEINNGIRPALCAAAYHHKTHRMISSYDAWQINAAIEFQIVLGDVDSIIRIYFVWRGRWTFPFGPPSPVIYVCVWWRLRRKWEQLVNYDWCWCRVYLFLSALIFCYE